MITELTLVRDGFSAGWTAHGSSNVDSCDASSIPERNMEMQEQETIYGRPTMAWPPSKLGHSSIRVSLPNCWSGWVFYLASGPIG
jgi:hypothetical protein